MVGYISKYLSYTQSCVGCIGRLVYSSKKLASGVARSIQKGLCVTGLMLVLGVCWRLPKRDVTEAYHKDIWFGCGQECSIRIVKSFWLSLWHREHGDEEEEEESLEQLSQWITENWLLDWLFCRSTRFDYHLPHKSCDEDRSENVQHRVVNGDEARGRSVCIDMWKPKWGWGKSSKAAHSDMKPQNTGPQSQA